LVYADDINILGRSVHTKKENTESLLVDGKEIALEVNADNTKYMVRQFNPRNSRSVSLGCWVRHVPTCVYMSHIPNELLVREQQEK
jgi:hypothetical protein